MPMKRLRDQIKRIGPTDVSILMHGESGTVKETVAEAIHKTSSRALNLSFQLIAELCQKSALKTSCLVLAKRRKANNPFAASG